MATDAALIKDANVYKAVQHKHTINKADIDMGIKLTDIFIRENGCILSGGMAIDFALRLKNEALYQHGTLPDFDPWSDAHLAMTENLARILCNANIKDVTVSNATHISTRVVSVGIDRICEMTYIPTNIYNRVPTLDYNGLRIRHPHHQMCDMMFSLSRPLTEYPRENYMARLNKDAERLKKFLTHYPFDIRDRRLAEICTAKNTFAVPPDWGDFCVAGLACVNGITAGNLDIAGRTITYYLPDDEKLLILLHTLPTGAVLYKCGYLDNIPPVYSVADIHVSVDAKDVSCNTYAAGIVTNGYYELACMLLHVLFYDDTDAIYDIYKRAFDTLYVAMCEYESGNAAEYGSPLTLSGKSFWTGYVSIGCVIQCKALDDALADQPRIKYRPDRVAFKKTCDIPARAEYTEMYINNDFSILSA
jgi:hypothetical protein